MIQANSAALPLNDDLGMLREYFSREHLPLR